MKIRFKHQPYQQKAVESIVECFAGQPRKEGIEYRIDPGRVPAHKKGLFDEEETAGFKNHELTITRETLLQNIKRIQRSQNLPIDKKLVSNSISPINLDVEMETGTGKTYVYTKTIFELHKRYGWSKFIIVVPSIAIREGVAQSFELTKEHFLEDYGKQARWFIYNSKSPQDIKSFSTDGGIHVMIINVQAFNAESNARSKDARRIYMELDEFESRRPIDLIKANRPILILDEPQKMEGTQTVKKLKEFDPLMILRFSATHKTRHNLIYRLDALDAYNQKLVKKIAVKGISVKNLAGTGGYLYLQNIEISKSKPPVARVEFEIKQNNGIKRIVRKLEKGDNLYELSNQLEQYQEGYVVADIDANRNIVEFTGGTVLEVGEAVGDVSESMLRRIQIREAIRSHLSKEQQLYKQGIKVLSLFFIDEVAKYRYYDDDGEHKGEYAKIFEEEYQKAIEDMGNLFEPEHLEYLNKISAESTHNGYFSIDKKGRLSNPTKVNKRGEYAGFSDDVDAYDLILKDKQRLLSFEEPTRFIFSHSALREGWDNPNIFVIGTLKHSDSTVARRQEVGRGMRLCVNQHGERIDDPSIVHEINVLTVVANESYKDFVAGLQKEISEAIADRPKEATEEYFTGKVVDVDGERVEIDKRMARKIERYLIKNDYVDDDNRLNDRYREDKEAGTLAPLPEELQPHAQAVFLLIDSVDSDVKLIEIEDESKRLENKPNDNLHKKEFLQLWERINKQAVYSVRFDSDELITNAANALDKELKVAKLRYRLIEGELRTDISDEDIRRQKGFTVKESEEVESDGSVFSTVSYDLVGKLASSTRLTRKTIGAILEKISEKTFAQYRDNPEAFIQKATQIINEQKATTVIEHLSYDKTDRVHQLEDIFTAQNEERTKLKDVTKHVYDYVSVDSKTEEKFATELDTAKEVVVYAKLPKSFYIPTPVGHYSPDWAIAFQDGAVRHIYFVAETKGNMSTMELRKIEKVKTDCARKFFKNITSDQVKYDVVESFEKLMQVVNS